MPSPLWARVSLIVQCAHQYGQRAFPSDEAQAPIGRHQTDAVFTQRPLDLSEPGPVEAQPGVAPDQNRVEFAAVRNHVLQESGQRSAFQLNAVILHVPADYLVAGGGEPPERILLPGQRRGTLNPRSNGDDRRRERGTELAVPMGICRHGRQCRLRWADLL